MTVEEQSQIVCHNIRVLRRKHGLSRTAMARRIHVTLKTLDSMEAGVIPDRIGILFLYHVMQAFGISPQNMLMVPLQEDTYTPGTVTDIM